MNFLVLPIALLIALLLESGAFEDEDETVEPFNRS
jgi:hypothetical protein